VNRRELRFRLSDLVAISQLAFTALSEAVHLVLGGEGEHVEAASRDLGHFSREHVTDINWVVMGQLATVTELANLATAHSEESVLSLASIMAQEMARGGSKADTNRF